MNKKMSGTKYTNQLKSSRSYKNKIYWEKNQHKLRKEPILLLKPIIGLFKHFFTKWESNKLL